MKKTYTWWINQPTNYVVKRRINLSILNCFCEWEKFN